MGCNAVYTIYTGYFHITRWCKVSQLFELVLLNFVMSVKASRWLQTSICYCSANSICSLPLVIDYSTKMIIKWFTGILIKTAILHHWSKQCNYFKAVWTKICTDSSFELWITIHFRHYHRTTNKYFDISASQGNHQNCTLLLVVLSYFSD